MRGDTVAGNSGSSWLYTVSDRPRAASSPSSGGSSPQVGQSRFTTATSPSGSRGEASVMHATLVHSRGSRQSSIAVACTLRCTCVLQHFPLAAIRDGATLDRLDGGGGSWRCVEGCFGRGVWWRTSWRRTSTS